MGNDSARSAEIIPIRVVCSLMENSRDFGNKIILSLVTPPPPLNLVRLLKTERIPGSILMSLRPVEMHLKDRQKMAGSPCLLVVYYISSVALRYPNPHGKNNSVISFLYKKNEVNRSTQQKV